MAKGRNVSQHFRGHGALTPETWSLTLRGAPRDLGSGFFPTGHNQPVLESGLVATVGDGYEQNQQ